MHALNVVAVVVQLFTLSRCFVYSVSGCPMAAMNKITTLSVKSVNVVPSALSQPSELGKLKTLVMQICMCLNTVICFECS